MKKIFILLFMFFLLCIVSINTATLNNFCAMEKFTDTSRNTQQLTIGNATLKYDTSRNTLICNTPIQTAGFSSSNSMVDGSGNNVLSYDISSGVISASKPVVVTGKLKVVGDLENTENALFASNPKNRGKTRVIVGTDLSVANTVSVRDALLFASSGTNTWGIQHPDANDNTGNLIISPVTIETNSDGYLIPKYDENNIATIKLRKQDGLFTPNIRAQYGVYAPSLVLQKTKADGKLGEIYLRARDKNSIEYYDMDGRTPVILDHTMINPTDPTFNSVTANRVNTNGVSFKGTRSDGTAGETNVSYLDDYNLKYYDMRGNTRIIKT
jgi:hypothetical protein